MGLWQIVGILLQVGGTGVAAWALNDNLKAFGDGRGLIPPLTRAVTTIRRRLGRIPNQVVSPDFIGSGSGTGTLTVHGRVEVGPDAAIGEQVAYLRLRVEEQQSSMERLRAAIGGAEYRLQDQLGVLASEAAQRDQQLRTDLSRVAAGSARAEILGLSLVVLGTFISALG